MKTFNDLVFTKHSAGEGKMSQLFFPNGFGISVVRFKIGNHGSRNGYGSYTSNESEWEVAVLKGNEESWDLTYETNITEDVIGYLSDTEVTQVMKQIQELK